MRASATLGALAALAFGTATIASAAEPIEVMVLGTWHFANPGSDVHNVKAEDVTTPRRQAELAAVADALAAFRPTKIIIERNAANPDLIDPDYAAFDAAQLASNPDERAQIGYRLARQLNLPHVYAINEDGDFPFGKVTAFAEDRGLEARLAEVMAEAKDGTRRFEERQPSSSIATLLIGYNDAEGFGSGHASYYELLKFSDPADQPGAELNAMWYWRNARIWTRLMSVAKPGDRVIVVYGAGHNYWLRHFASETPGYRNVDPRPFLEKAIADARR